MPLNIYKPMEHFFISSALFLIAFFLVGGIFYMANVRSDIAIGISMFIGWFAFISVWLSATIPNIRWVDTRTEYGCCGCHCQQQHTQPTHQHTQPTHQHTQPTHQHTQPTPQHTQQPTPQPLQMWTSV